MRRLPKGRKCRVCGKRRYATSEAAMLVVERASERRQEKRAYFAHGWWHVTSMPGREIRNAEQPSPEVPELRGEHKQPGTTLQQLQGDKVDEKDRCNCGHPASHRDADGMCYDCSRLRVVEGD